MKNPDMSHTIKECLQKNWKSTVRKYANQLTGEILSEKEKG